MMKSTIIMAVMLVASAGAAWGGDPAEGQKSFRKCMPCHDAGPNAKNKVGPILNGLDGRHSGSVEGYSYSAANKNSGITWNEQTFKEYITDPKAKIPGTKMVFAGIKNDKERDDLWSYLAQFNADGSKK